jgi:hypothetical protein
MRFPWSAVRVRIPLPVVAGIGALGCSEVAGSAGREAPIRVALGDTVSVDFVAGETERQLRFEVPGPGYYALFGQAVSGRVRLTVIVPTGQPSPTSVEHSVVPTPGLPLLRSATPVFPTFVNGIHQIVATNLGGGPGVFRLLVYPVNLAPESRPGRIAVGDTVAESLQTIADVDAYVFSASVGDELNAFVQALPGGEGDRLLLSLSRLDFAGPGAFGARGDTGLYDHATGTFVIPIAGDWQVTLAADRGFGTPYAGPYRFQVFRINRAPENTGATLALGDTVEGETIWPPGDIDEFSFTAQAGQQLNLFAQAQDFLFSDVVGFAGLISFGDDTALAEQASGTFAIPSTGSYTLRVRGADGASGGDRGPYRFLLYPINPAPEDAPARLTLGDSVQDAIELPGDVDSFTLQLANPSWAVIVLGKLNLGPSDSPVLRGGEPVPICGLGVTFGARCLYASGEYTFEVRGTVSTGDGYRGPYFLKVVAIDSQPEVASPVVLIGDTVDGETIEPDGDVDRYAVYARRGDFLRFSIQGQAAPAPWGFLLGVLHPTTGELVAWVGSPASAASLSENQTRRVDVATDGWYPMWIASGNPEEGGRVGPYRFAVTELPTVPETAPAGIVVGDSVGVEGIDFLDDVDDFMLRGAPNQEFAVMLQGQIALQIYDTATRTAIGSQGSVGFVQATGRFVLPASGEIGIRVIGALPSPYWFKAYPINRAPETASATIGIGDTVSGESIWPYGDIDEFTFSGTPGLRLRVYFQTPNGTLDYQGVVLELVDPSSTVLDTVVSVNPTANLEDQATDVVTLSSTGSHHVRVRGRSDQSSGATEYRFRVAVVP